MRYIVSAFCTVLYFFLDKCFCKRVVSFFMSSGNLDCEYSGVVHQSGEAWSPGPCVPKCHCDNGHIKCSKLECPDLNCDKPVKRRWKCCPECLPNADSDGMSYRCPCYILYIYFNTDTVGRRLGGCRERLEIEPD